MVCVKHTMLSPVTDKRSLIGWGSQIPLKVRPSIFINQQKETPVCTSGRSYRRQPIWGWDTYSICIVSGGGYSLVWVCRIRVVRDSGMYVFKYKLKLIQWCWCNEDYHWSLSLCSGGHVIASVVGQTTLWSNCWIYLQGFRLFYGE